MTDKEVLQKVLDKAKEEDFVFGSNELKIDEKDGETGFYEGGHFYTFKEMMTLTGIKKAIWGESMVKLGDEKELPAILYYSGQALQKEKPWEYVATFL